MKQVCKLTIELVPTQLPLHSVNVHYDIVIVNLGQSQIYVIF